MLLIGSARMTFLLSHHRLTLMKTLVIILCSILFIGCTSQKSEQPIDEVYRIVIANASSCWPSPYEVMSIDTSLTLQYHGVAFVDDYGCHKGAITSTTWQILRDSCATLLNIPSDTCWNAEDARIVEVIIYSSKGVQRFYGESSCLHDNIVSFYNRLWRIKEVTSLQRTDTFDLETSAQSDYDGFPLDPESPYIFERDTSIQLRVPES